MNPENGWFLQEQEGEEEETQKMKFNRTSIFLGETIDQPDVKEIRASSGLWQASIEDAVRFGGPVTKAAISAMNFRNDRKFIVVDVKIHMLMPGMNPAIPSWHTDGVPRLPDGSPISKGAPDIYAQEFSRPPRYALQEEMKPHRFHALVTGSVSLTEFVDETLELQIPSEPDTSLYTMIHNQVESRKPKTIKVPSCQVVEFDWWNIHRGTFANGHEWRFFIRATETDYWAPQTDLRSILRSQQQVYVKENFGW